MAYQHTFFQDLVMLILMYYLNWFLQMLTVYTHGYHIFCLALRFFSVIGYVMLTFLFICKTLVYHCSFQFFVPFITDCS